MRTSTRIWTAANVWLLAGTAFASAQAPQQTTASFQDWTVRCVQAESQPQKQCEMVQSASVKGQAAPISQIAIGRPEKTGPIKIVVQLPIAVWLPANVKLVLDPKDPKAPALTAVFKRCNPGACVADMELKDDVAKRMRGIADQGRLDFENGNQQPVMLPVSFRGFAQAFDAMAKE